MQLTEQVFSVLIVSSSSKFNDSISKLLNSSVYQPIEYANSINLAQRKCIERFYDLVLINTPLTDDFGIKFAVDLSCKNSSACLLFVSGEVYASVHDKVCDYGVFAVSKPVSGIVFNQSLDWLKTTRQRLKRLEKKTVTLQEKMDEIKIINRAKWTLINSCNMSEEDAHRYIEKQAMDRCLTRKEIAENILKTYL